MKDPRYKFAITVSAHILIVDRVGRVLLSKRPANWEWGPGRWGLTGGKIYEHENFFTAIKRKTVQELGFEVTPDGLYQVKQLLIKDKQAFMFFFVSRYMDQEIVGEMEKYKWFGVEELKNAERSEFAEYFYKEMLTGFLQGEVKLLPTSMIESFDYTKMSDEDTYKEWFEGMINKKYDPEKLKDYQIWKKKIRG